ncbi:MAG: LppX_LprAFG lipoprotein [Haloechinothrix sp.]
MRYRPIALLLALALGAITGCTSTPDPAPPSPDAAMLAGITADSLDDLRSATLSLRTTGAIPGLVVQRGDAAVSTVGGDTGTAHGEATLYDVDGGIGVEFTLAEGTLTLTDKDGERTELPAEGKFAPTTLFSRDGPLGALLTRATNLRTEGVEELDGVPTYRLSGALAQSVIAEQLPGITSDVEVKFWVGGESTPALHRVWIQVPPPRPNQGAAMLELGLSEHNVPIPPSR